MPSFAAFFFFNLIAIGSLAQQIPARPVVANGEASLPNAPEAVRLRERQLLLSSPSKLADISAATTALRPAEDHLGQLDGLRVKLSVVTEISSKLPSHSKFQARVNQPVSLRGHVLLPQGTILEGHLVTKPARRIMRSGSMLLSFDRVILPDGETPIITAHVVSSASPALRRDEEGMLHPRLSKKRLAIQAGGTALAAKFADDLAQLAGGAAVGAGSARLAGIGAAGIFLALQKGREARLRPGDEIEVEFGRPSEP